MRALVALTARYLAISAGHPIVDLRKTIPEVLVFEDFAHSVGSKGLVQGDEGNDDAVKCVLGERVPRGVGFDESLAIEVSFSDVGEDMSDLLQRSFGSR